MKSLLVSSSYFPPNKGGISHMMAEVAKNLGTERVCCLTGVPQKKSGTENDNPFRVYTRLCSGNGYTKALRLGLTITEILIRERPRIIQLSTVGEGRLVPLLKKWIKIPFVVYAHGNEILMAMGKGPKSIELITLRKADRILAVSEYTADLVRRAGVDPKMIEIVHPGCDSERFHPTVPTNEFRKKLLGPRHKDRIILTIGNLVSRKGHDMVIRALPRVLKSALDVTYLIVGEGPYRSQLERLAKDMQVEDRVVFAGQVEQEDIPEVYGMCEVFTMPSRDQTESCDVEGFGLVFLEANASGKPVIAGRSGGIPDAVIEGVSGLLVNPTDIDEIANAIVKLLLNRDLATRLGSQGRERVMRDFNWEGIANRIQGILEGVIKS
ncbi:MAG TPA: glycosyltransferase family 4 protein [Nitrospirales bacterium]|nr:hypothetical protein [Nitrospiraceae bacterium]HNP28724.1 glycosyltransferase family 4 protein [Nitrospirales bacterium]